MCQEKTQSENTCITMREARLGDADALIELFADLGYHILHPHKFKCMFKKMLRRRDVWGLFVAEVVSQPAGFISVHIQPCLRLEGFMARIEELVVKEEWRGIGIGGMLLNNAIRFAHNRGCKRIEVLSSKWRESYTRKFYAKHGFVEHNSAVFRIHNYGITAGNSMENNA